MRINKCGEIGLIEKKMVFVASMLSKIGGIRPRMFLLLALSILTFGNNKILAQSKPICHAAPSACMPKISELDGNTDRSSSKEQPLSLTLYDCGHPTNEEQYQLELINRARANPDSEGIWLATDTDLQVVSDFAYYKTIPGYFAPDSIEVESSFAAYPPRPPLAFNADLCWAARFHDTAMIEVDSQYDYGPDGSPEARLDSSGYSGWTNLGENAYAYGADMDGILAYFLVDWGNPNLVQRYNIMNFASPDSIFNEVGIGILHGYGTLLGGDSNVGPILATEDFAKRPSMIYILGVVYTDSNKNGFYDIGEGDSGVKITLAHGTNYYAITSGSGGYAIPLSTPIDYDTCTITASGGPFLTPVSKVLVLEAKNVKVDFIVPQTPLGNATLLTPKNGSTVSDTVAFTWASVPAASNYVLLVSKNSNLTKPFAVNDTLGRTVTTDTASQSRLEASTTYYWGIIAENDQGSSGPGTIWSFTTPAVASVDEPFSAQTATSISPNPTAGESRIRFALRMDADVSLRIFNTVGEEVQSLALGHLSPALYDYPMDFSKLPPGSYTYELCEGDWNEMGRIVILR